MSSLDGLYQEVILDHTKRPRNFRVIEGANRKAEGYNPLCGDKVTVYLNIVDGKISDISFQGSGCAISTASASLLTETLKGKTEAEVEALFDSFHDLVTKGQVAGRDSPDLGKLEVFSGVSEFPARVKCATLSWHTLRAALAKTKAESSGTEAVSTE
jgi:nitrogen fixation protein NifU and related proteins